MKNDTNEGCPRCRDYEKVKDELESNKRKAQDDQKSALKRCEDSKAKLQKKLLTVGAAAVVGGTILGKDFVDKIAEYIESFNSVKDGATKLISKADIPTPPNPPKKNDDDTEDIDDYFSLTFAPREVDMSMWPAGMMTSHSKELDRMMSGYGSMSIIDIIAESQLNANYDYIDDDILNPPPLSVYDLTTFNVPFDVPFTMDTVSDYTPMDPPAYYGFAVPETSTISLLAFPLAFSNTRRR